MAVPFDFLPKPELVQFPYKRPSLAASSGRADQSPSLPAGIPFDFPEDQRLSQELTGIVHDICCL